MASFPSACLSPDIAAVTKLRAISVSIDVKASGVSSELEGTAPAMRPLSWALVIATYSRTDVLAQCLRFALVQSRPPDEVIIVDASADFEVAKTAIAAVAGDYPRTRLIHQAAKRRSIPAQRNQGVALATADIVFLIDDDAFLYGHSAAEIMRIYDADSALQVAGIMACPTSRPPGENEADTLIDEELKQQTPSIAARLSAWARSAAGIERTYFLPYSASLGAVELSPQVASLSTARLDVMVGFAMTFRRTVVEVVGFCPFLDAYAAGEDQDFSHRAQSHGVLLLAANAPIYHLGSAGGRLPLWLTIALADLNPAAMQVYYGNDQKRLEREWRRILWKRLLLRLLKDVRAATFDFPRTRGTLVAFRHLHTIYGMSPEAVPQLYPILQRKLLGRALPA